MRQFRKEAGLTQAEAERLSGVSRDYIGSIEAGRVKIIYPDFQRKLAHAYRQPGYLICEAMGYQTDCGKQGVVPALSLFMANLTEAQQRALLEVARATFRAAEADGDRID